jgi:hypothetical protein
VNTLDRRILDAIASAAIDEETFNRLAIDIFAYQLEYNAPYAAYAQMFGSSQQRLPATWREIPAIPTAAFKEATLCTFPRENASLHFVTSGTTQGTGGHHYLDTAALYDASLLAGFDRFMLADGAALRYFNLVPDPRERPTSSLGYMMHRVAGERGDGRDGWYLHGEELDVERFIFDLQNACNDGAAVCLAGTAFAFVALIDALGERGRAFVAPAGSRIMETGGFKGRSRHLEREALYVELSRRFGIATDAIVAEYGMTELCAQYYDTPASRANRTRIKGNPPWIRALIVDGDGREVPAGTVGALRHIDLSNRSSVVAIETEDLGYACDDGFVLLGRESGAELRGCSLDAEDLDVARR